MKIACQESIVPGDTFREKVDNLVEVGFEGVELTAPLTADGSDALEARVEEVMDVVADAPLSVSSICGGQPMAFLAADPALRRAAMEGYKKVLRVAGLLQCAGPILVPVFGPPQLADGQPLERVVQREIDMLVEICKELADVAAENRTNVVLEPLNRYETHLLNTLEDAARICALAGDPPALKIMADFFHMNIEEPDIPESIRKCGSVICHVHLADSTRKEPGSAHTDFAGGLKALKDVGYQGHMAFECGLSRADRMAALRESVAYLKNIRSSV